MCCQSCEPTSQGAGKTDLGDEHQRVWDDTDEAPVQKLEDDSTLLPKRMESPTEFARGESCTTNTESVASSPRESSLSEIQPPNLTGRQVEDIEFSRQCSDESNFTVSDILNVHKVRRKLRLSVSNPNKPSQADIDRRLTVQNVYDFYDPQARNVRIRKMTGSVVHRRRKSVIGALDCETHEAFSDAGSEASEARSEEINDSSSPLTSAHSHSDSASDHVDSEIRRHQSKKSVKDTEALANWGAIVGKVLHRKVLDFESVNEKALRERRGLGRRLEPESSRQGNRLATRRCKAVVDQALSLARKEGRRRHDITDHEWDTSSLMTRLFSTEYTDTLMIVTTAAAKILAAQPPMVSVASPCRVFGDLHGQLRDLFMFFHAFGMPGETSTNFVFNGDFVDRGSHQVELIGVLLALKVVYPTQIYLIRGNHEDSTMNERYGFRDACSKVLGAGFGSQIYKRMQDTFNLLPLACLVSDRALILHGGIGEGKWRLGDLWRVHRPLTPEQLIEPSNRWLYNILWSDPIEDGETADPDKFGVHPSPRGVLTLQFSWDITKTFCARNGISLIIRSHESKKDGRGFDLMHSDMLLRVFSARDYEDHSNDSAVLLITEEATPVYEEGRETVDILTVRPQVLRSVHKSRAEATRRSAEEASGA